MSRLILALLFVVSLTAQAASIGDDGLHKQEWFALTFKDVAEDIEDAQSDGKRLVLLFEQRGCIYCTKMHEKILSDTELVSICRKTSTLCNTTCLAMMRLPIWTVR